MVGNIWKALGESCEQLRSLFVFDVRVTGPGSLPGRAAIEVQHRQRLLPARITRRAFGQRLPERQRLAVSILGLARLAPGPERADLHERLREELLVLGAHRAGGMFGQLLRAEIILLRE